MGFMDSKWEFWDAQALTAQEESRTNGNIVDLETDGATDAQLGFLWWNLLVGVAAADMASGGYFQLVTSDSETFVTGTGGEQVLGSFGSNENPLFAAQLVKGARFSLGVPLFVCHKYLEVEWIDISEDASALTVDSWMGLEPLSPLNTQKEPS